MPSCFVCGRSRNQKSKQELVTFHRFPTDTAIRKKWFEFLLSNSLSSDAVTKNSLICSMHFKPNNFIFYNRRTLLNTMAVPSVNVVRIKSAKQLFPEELVPNTSTKSNCKNQGSEQISPESSIIGIASLDGNSELEPITPKMAKQLCPYELVPSTSSGSHCSDQGSEQISPDASIIALSSFDGNTRPVLDESITQKKKKIKSSFLLASQPVDSDSPGRLFLKKGIVHFSNEAAMRYKKCKILQQTVRRQKQKIHSLNSIINKLKNKNLLNEDASEVLLESFGKHQNLISNLRKKNLGQSVQKKYSPLIRQFALTLHFHSAKAYDYVRKEFNTILPHARTLSKWYSHVNANPGFTDESLNMLTLKQKYSAYPLYCSLMMDEMAIRQHLEFDGTNYYGRVDLGSGLNSDSLDIAKEVFSFMVVAVNENWKLPIGYFLTNGLNSSQKSELVRHALDLLLQTNITIVSLTFDGCTTNISVAQQLGCSFNIDNLNTKLLSCSKNFANKEIVVILDAAHMVKLVRNAFAERKQFIDKNGMIIDFDYIKKLFILQEQEGCHLANKLRKQHIFFFKQKMKVKLASQLLSQSVADALKFCKFSLDLKEFSEVDATIVFIEMFNKAFDILNSRSDRCFGTKKALCQENFQDVHNFCSTFINYIKLLKIKDINGQFLPVLQSNRKTGFIGFIVSLTSTLELFNSFVVSEKLNCIKLYKLSQDHLELFFGNIRSQNGYNNNPTARQFRSAYKKLVIHVNNVQMNSSGNCIPLEDIDILHYSSSDPVKVINENTTNINYDPIFSEENGQLVDSFINDHDYIITQNTYKFSDFTKEIIIYIAGFVVHKLSSVIHCETCIKALHAVDKKIFLHSLIFLKNRDSPKGGLIYPSDDVILICLQTEKTLKYFNYQNKAINNLKIQSQVLHHFLNNLQIFRSLNFHSQEINSPLSDHVPLLIKSISKSYTNLKVKYSLKTHNETPSLRMWYNKLILFKGQ